MAEVATSGLRYSRQVRDEYEADVFITRNQPMRDVLALIKNMELGSWGSEYSFDLDICFLIGGIVSYVVYLYWTFMY